MRLRGQTLFYAAAVAYMRDMFEPQSHQFRDDFAGDLIIHNDTQIICVEIKSELELKNVSTTSGTKFQSLRTKINALPHMSGQDKGWLAYLAQPFDYMSNYLPEDIRKEKFIECLDVLVLPLSVKGDLLDSLHKTHERFSVSEPEYVLLTKPSENLAIFLFNHSNLKSFFRGVEDIDS